MDSQALRRTGWKPVNHAGKAQGQAAYVHQQATNLRPGFSTRSPHDRPCQNRGQLREEPGYCPLRGRPLQAPRLRSRPATPPRTKPQICLVAPEGPRIPPELNHSGWEHILDAGAPGLQNQGYSCSPYGRRSTTGGKSRFRRKVFPGARRPSPEILQAATGQLDPPVAASQQLHRPPDPRERG